MKKYISLIFRILALILLLGCIIYFSSWYEMNIILPFLVIKSCYIMYFIFILQVILCIYIHKLFNKKKKAFIVLLIFWLINIVCFISYYLLYVRFFLQIELVSDYIIKHPLLIIEMVYTIKYKKMFFFKYFEIFLNKKNINTNEKELLLRFIKTINMDILLKEHFFNIQNLKRRCDIIIIIYEEAKKLMNKNTISWKTSIYKNMKRLLAIAALIQTVYNTGLNIYNIYRYFPIIWKNSGNIYIKFYPFFHKILKTSPGAWWFDVVICRLIHKNFLMRKIIEHYNKIVIFKYRMEDAKLGAVFKAWWLWLFSRKD